MTRQRVAGSILCFVVTTAILSCSAADLILNTCDNSANWSAINGASVGAATHGIDPAIQVTLPTNAGGAVPTVFSSSNTPYVPSGSTQTYDGISFWVKGDGSTQWGNIALWYDTTNYYRVYAQFPIPTTWTQVFIPWREFYERTMAGRMETRYTDVFGILFTVSVANFPGHPLTAVPAMAYQIDDIHMVAAGGIPLASTPLPTGISIKKTVAKLKAQQPVKIVVSGASIAFGLKTQNPATDCWPYKLQELLKTQYGYSNITIVNNAIGGLSSHQGGTTLGWFVANQEPIDLLITCDWCANDFFNLATGADLNFANGEIAHNYEDLFGYVLRRNTCELMNVQSGLVCDPNAFHSMDATNATVQNVCNTMNIYTADLYGKFQALGEPWLQTNYYTYDTVHFNEAAHTAAAQIVLDAIVAAGNNHPPVLTSAAHASPAAANTGQSITFTAAASDIDADPLTYAWDFGDGASDTGASTSHSYASAGTFTATATITDGRGGSLTTSVNVTITAPSSGSGNGGDGGNGTGGTGGGGTTSTDPTLDSDNDGVSDVNELADGTNPFDPNSFVKTPMTLKKMQGGVNFAKSGHDTCSVSGTIPAVPALFNPAGAMFKLNVGGATASFTLDKNGHAATSNGTVALKLKPSKRNKATGKAEFQGGDVAFTALLKNDALASNWNSAGIVNTTEKNSPVTLTIDVTFAGRVYTATATALYSAKEGASGKFKK